VYSLIVPMYLLYALFYFTLNSERSRSFLHVAGVGVCVGVGIARLAPIIDAQKEATGLGEY